MYVYAKELPIMTTQGLHNAKVGDEARDLSQETIDNYISRGILIVVEDKPLPRTGSVLRSVKAIFGAKENKSE